MRTDIPRQWLRELRTKRGLTLKDVGEKLDIAWRYVGDIECGRRNPSSNLAYRFSQLFDCQMEQFYHDAKPNEVRGKGRKLQAEAEKVAMNG